MELSRIAASGGLFDGESTCKPDPDAPKPPDTNHPNAYGRVNPFNPCLPYRKSRTCPWPSTTAPAPRSTARRTGTPLQ